MGPIRDNRKVRPVLPVVVLSSISHEIVWVTVSVLNASLCWFMQQNILWCEKRKPTTQLSAMSMIPNNQRILCDLTSLPHMTSGKLIVPYSTVHDYNVYITILSIIVLCR